MIFTRRRRKEHVMLKLLQAAFLMGGNMVFFELLFLPAVILLGISIVYIVADAIHTFRMRRGWF